MAEEPTLPRLPHALPSGSRPKRARGAASSPHESTSSDPAFFSSDDDPALDNYQGQGRRKRRYVGAWFDQQPASSDSGVDEETRPMRPPPRPSTQKREFKRQLDSGIWMGPDGGLTDTDDSVDFDPAPPRLPLASRPAQTPMAQPSPARPRLSRAEETAQTIILRCIDDGEESVDLSGLELGTVSDGILEQISAITPIPDVAMDVAFEQREPKIKVFLSCNRLARFPRALLDIEHLTVLSLRNNRLDKIPPGISKLTNLATLNISQNKLRFLPAELLQLLQRGSKLRELLIQPNPFWVAGSNPESNLGGDKYERHTFGYRPDMMDRSDWTGLTTRLTGRTPVQFVDNAYRVHSRFAFPPFESSARATIELESFEELATPGGVRLRSEEVNYGGVKSLFELALHASISSGQADQIAVFLREEEGLPHLAPAVETALEIERGGGVRCSVCGKDTIVPLASWVEFRDIYPEAIVAGRTHVAIERRTVDVPFMRVGCSWKCIPVRVTPAILYSTGAE